MNENKQLNDGKKQNMDLYKKYPYEEAPNVKYVDASPDYNQSEDENP